MSDEWAKRNTKVIGISVDSAEDHTKWKADIEKFGGSKAGFPIIADTDLKVAKAFDMLPSEAHLPEGRTPADWQVGQDVIVALSLNDEQAKEKYGELDVKLPYLRTVKS